jgi:hypothetical protein
MKIGKLDFKDYSAKKPVTISPKGKMVSAQDVLAVEDLQVGTLSALSKEDQIKLALARYDLEPDFKLGTIGVGLRTKKEIMQHIKAQDAFGQTALQAEMAYCNELITSLTSAKLPAEPVIPQKPISKIPDSKIVKKTIWIKLKTRALFCENTTDAVTTPFANYRIANVHPVFAARGFSVVALTGASDVRTQFVPQAKNGLTVYLSGVGHGSYTLYTGNAGDHILEVGHYAPAEVAGKSAHFLSCETGGSLGPDTVAKGAKSYAGYTENFNLVWDDSTTSSANEFECFAKADSTFDIAMARGLTAQQAKDATIAMFNAMMVLPGIPGSAAATWLKYDRDHLALFGAGTATISPYRMVKITIPLVDIERQNALVAAGELAE